MRPNALPFVRMNGLGNEILVVDARAAGVAFDAEAVRRIGAGEGMAFDQLMLVERGRGGLDAYLRVYNIDGSEVSSCGNGTRCVAAVLMAESGREALVLETRAGPLVCTAAGDDVTVDMGAPRFAWNEIPLSEPFHDTRTIELQVGPLDAPILHSPSVVSMGNPHAVFWVDDVQAYDLGAIGPMLEHHPLFPERANIGLAHVAGRDAITLRVWERGAGLTLACGTAACAAAVAAMRLGRVDRRVSVTLPGGTLLIEWRASDGHVLMTGPVETEFEGVLDLDSLAPEAA